MRRLPWCTVLLLFCSCSPAQWQAAKSELEWLRELAGDVCLEHDDWQACLKKCEHASESEEQAAP